MTRLPVTKVASMVSLLKSDKLAQRLTLAWVSQKWYAPKLLFGLPSPKRTRHSRTGSLLPGRMAGYRVVAELPSVAEMKKATRVLAGCPGIVALNTPSPA